LTFGFYSYSHGAMLPAIRLLPPDNGGKFSHPPIYIFSFRLAKI